MVLSAIPRKMGLIVAMDVDGGIAKGGKIPWRLQKDMAFFKMLTSKTVDESKRNAVVMGRKCWESIPEKFRPLSDRLNIVISRTMEEENSKDLIVANDFSRVLEELSSGPLAKEIETIWNIGGTEIYRLALENDLIDRLVVTKIDKRFDSDLILNIDWDSFDENEKDRQIVEERGTNFTIHFYNRSPN